jgi:sarcosine oxidase subunit alpha
MVSRGRPAMMERVRAGSVVLATGAFDTIPLFANNDMPGVFGTRGLRLFLERDGMALGTRALLYGSGREADDAAALLQSHGVAVVSRIEDSRLLGVDGRDWVRSARVETAGGSRRVACDLVCVAVAGQPDFALTQQAGFAFALDGVSGGLAVMRPTADRLERDGQRVFLVGETAGIAEWVRKIEHAAAAGRDAARWAIEATERTQ